ncbi:Pentatricopeptide repeat-containing protein [Vitis vinifera]|uniref:Pentatricopeptide repeat-containing protein n=1 Tax=Vitis vinifera TaxID=29760 RepID=A0A438F3K9_VITVI|nr:Pentatricopeptide repeat-containing protein [Vitis vinifera]
MVDLYGRAGRIKEAWNVVKSMPMEPDVLVWGALLSGSRMHGDIETYDSHPETRQIHMMLEEILERLKVEGYVKHKGGRSLSEIAIGFTILHKDYAPAETTGKLDYALLSMATGKIVKSYTFQQAAL